MSRWSSGQLLDYEPRGSGSIPEVRNLEICILRIPSHKIQNIEYRTENIEYRIRMGGGKPTFSFQENTSPGRMAETPRAGTGDSACRR